MKTSDAIALTQQVFNDYFAGLRKSEQMCMKDPLEAALKALAPIPDEPPAKEADHG
jgi:hypothetical protein